MATTTDVVAARRKLLDVIYAITGTTEILVDYRLATELTRAWDEYDQAVIRQHVILNQGPG